MDPNLDPYLARIQSWDPELDLSNVRLDPYGLNNLVFIVNDAVVFRFPRNDRSREKLRQEAKLLAVVSRHVSTAVPLFRFGDEDDVAVYPLVPGTPIYRHYWLRLPEGLQSRFARGIGRFLSQLHAIPIQELLDGGLAPAPAGQTELWADRLTAVRTELYPYLWADQQAWIEDLFAPMLDGRLDMLDYSPCLIHNDLATYHLLGDSDTGELTGVLDFGSAEWGDPAEDLATLISGYGESLLLRLGDSYSLDQTMLERARVRAGYLELEWALKGLRKEDPEWYLVHIGRARDMRPFGTIEPR